MGKTKGVTANNYLEYVGARAPGELLEQIKSRMDEKARAALFARPIPPGIFVDYGAVMQFLLAADDIVGKGDRALLRDASCFNQETNLKGIYKALLPFASTEFIIKIASKLWTRYHDTGHVSTERLGPATIGLTLHDYPDIPLHHGPEIEGAFVGLLSLAGSKVESITHTKCVNQGDPACKWEITWIP